MIATPYFGRVMSRNRFQIIWRFLQFKDPDVVVDAEMREDNLHKVRPVLAYLQTKFATLYQPNKNIGIDEGMLKWRGRLHFRYGKCLLSCFCFFAFLCFRRCIVWCFLLFFFLLSCISSDVTKRTSLRSTVSVCPCPSMSVHVPVPVPVYF